jgi:hypothetical protein
LASLFIGHGAQQSKLHNLQYDEGGNHMAETETFTSGVATHTGSNDACSLQSNHVINKRKKTEFLLEWK